jgi:hypothetical protein
MKQLNEETFGNELQTLNKKHEELNVHELLENLVNEDLIRLMHHSLTRFYSVNDVKHANVGWEEWLRS